MATDDESSTRSGKDEDILKRARADFKMCGEAEQDNRTNWLDDVRFARLGEQWPDEIRRQREAEGRPCLTINRLPSFIRQVLNDARQNKPSIKCHPVDDDASDETSEILNGLIRCIEYNSNADVAYDTALDHAVTGGFGYFRISTDYANDDVFDQDICIERIPNPLNVRGDPYSTKADSSDWNVAFVDELLSEEDFESRWPKAAKKPFDADDTGADDWFEDDKIRIAEYWVRDEVAKTIYKLSDGSVMDDERYQQAKDLLDVTGVTISKTRETKTHKVTQYIITGAEVLETNDWAGKYIPIIPVYGDEVNEEGKRHFISLIRGSKDAQRMFNYWRTTSTELVALAPKTPFIGRQGAFNTDEHKWATANTQSHAYIEYDGSDAPKRQEFAGVPAGALQEALNASDDMKSIMGIFDASLGAKSNETSGRAIMARQREGDVSTFNFIDNLSRAIRHAGRVIVDLIPHVYNVPRIIRIMHDDGTNESVKINQEHQAEQPNKDQNGMGAQQGPMGEQEQNEQQEFQQGVIKLYDLTVGKYDVTCEAGPSYTTKREESAAQMMQFLQSFPNAAPMIGDLVAKNLDWPGADDIADRLKAMLPPQLQGANPMVTQMQQQMHELTQQAQQQINELTQQLQQAQQDQQGKAHEAQIKATELQLKQAEMAQQDKEMQVNAALKEQENQIKKFDAETKRMQAEGAQADAQTQAQQAGEESAMQRIGPVLEEIVGSINQVMQSHSELAAHVTAPRKIVRGPDGAAIGVDVGGTVKPINRGPDGRVEGI